MYTSKSRRRRGFYRALQKQMEYYLSDANLRHDKYISSLLNKQSSIPIADFVSFNEICKMGATAEDLKTSLKGSNTITLTVGNEVERKYPYVPKPQDEVDKGTLYLENIPPATPKAVLCKMFSSFGPVARLSIPSSHKIKVNSNIFGFCEFYDIKSCALALQAFSNIGSFVENGQAGASISEVTFNTHYSSYINKTEEITKPAAGAEVTPAATTVDTVLVDLVEKNDSANVHATTSENITKKKKRRRMRVPAPGIFRDDKYMGIRVMPKLAWNKMRDQYLSLQKQRRQQLKALIDTKKPSELSTKLIPGSVVQFHTERSANDADVKNVRANLGVETVLYVDFSIGKKTGYVRLKSADDAVKFIEHGKKLLPDFEFNSVPEEEEKKYFEKILFYRAQKRANPNPRRNMSAAKKIKIKAERHLSLKIRMGDVTRDFCDEPPHYQQ